MATEKRSFFKRTSGLPRYVNMILINAIIVLLVGSHMYDLRSR